ncbi:MAG: hypothetical protein KAX05_00955 [Bacteroidales bacterium]|nr:hypothetical protein [Bacteroidales bacterium]
MTKLFKITKERTNRVLEALVALTGISVFAAFIHSDSFFIIVAFLG